MKITYTLKKKIISFLLVILFIFGFTGIILFSCFYRHSPENSFVSKYKKKEYIGNYEKIYKNEYSLCFYNTKTPESSNTEESGYTFGTGWLFDWDIKQDQNNSWVGYFATNLHVADALCNPDDNVNYLNQNKDIITNFFWLGKWDDNDLSLLTSRSSDITYVRLSEIPKTQYAAIDFLPEKNESHYADFAVLEISLDLTKSWEKKVYDDWIQSSIDNLKILSNNGKVEDLFWRATLSDNDYQHILDPYSGLIGGYPFYYNGIDNTVNSFAIRTNGCPTWTINVNEDSVGDEIYSGQKFDVKNISKMSLMFPFFDKLQGFYFNDFFKNFELSYHSKTYKQVGGGLVINDSNLAGGSSGSMILDNKTNKIMSIYFGVIKEGNQELNYGLGQMLILDKSIVEFVNRFSQQKIFSYDLISGKNNLSYMLSLRNMKKTTYLFQQII